MSYGEAIAFASFLFVIAGALLKVLVTDPLNKIDDALGKLTSRLDVINEDVIIVKRDLKTCFNRYDELKAAVHELDIFVRGIEK